MFTCRICNSELIEVSELATCSYCGASEQADFVCPNGHYVCEDCRMATQTEIIERVCLHTKSTDPIELANLIMKHASFNQYGVEHHEMVAPVVLAALRNTGKTDITDGRIKAAIKRGSKIPYGSCGSMGTCGACVSAGAAIALVTNSNYLKDRERNLTLKTTAQSLLKLTELGGPRCCKYSTYVSIQSAWETLTEDLHLDLSPLTIHCDFQGILKECHFEKCPFYGK